MINTYEHKMPDVVHIHLECIHIDLCDLSVSAAMKTEKKTDMSATDLE